MILLLFFLAIFFWFRCNAVTTANISLPVVFPAGKKKKRKGYERDEDQCFYIRTKTKETDEDAPVEDHSEIYRLVQRDAKSISALQKAIDGKGLPIENISMAHRVLALIKGDTNVEDERGAPLNLGKVNGNKRRSPRARNQVKDNEKEEDGSGARATRRSKRRYSMQDEEEDAEEEEWKPPRVIITSASSSASDAEEEEEEQQEEEEEEEEQQDFHSLLSSSGMH
jgi:hypothetical protein